MDKKKLQLGMNPSTASHRLVKDLLWFFVQGESPICFRCDGPMTRETFSIEHKVPWLHSNDPVGLYFDLDNIAFSHQVCNVAARRVKKSLCGTKSRYSAGCRCSACTEANTIKCRENYCSDRRRATYLRTGQ